MSNFDYLSTIPEFRLFAQAAIEAEKVYKTSAAMCALGTRKALELGVKWVYSADETIQEPYRDNLMSLIHEESFRFSMERGTWVQLLYIVRLGNSAAHSEASVTASEAVTALKGLFEFVQWIEYCYCKEYTPRTFDESLIPKDTVALDRKKILQQQSLLEEKAGVIENLRAQIAEMSEKLTARKEVNETKQTFVSADPSEEVTRKRFIDVDLKQLGWIFEGPDANVKEEVKVMNMENKIGRIGYADYVLYGKDGLPLAVIEAKKTSIDPNNGRIQACLYADCFERDCGRRPMMFTSNGYETFFWDDSFGPQRKVSGFFSQDDLQKLMNRRDTKRALSAIQISDRITDRYYQKEAIRAVCDHIEGMFRKNLLVMATGTGKTRTASSLVDVLSRGGYITNVLFLADRTALVKQAKDDFKNYLPDMSLCNLCDNKDDASARIVFSTYPTMMNAIDELHTRDGMPMFTPAHFDLIIIDESHRSIFKKYKTIFDYFDAILVGLTATPRVDVDHNTYEFFELEDGVPTYAYDYETAVNTDHVLVPYYNYEADLKFTDDGIHYDELSDEDKERYEEDFAEDDHIPEAISSAELNRFIFNELTADKVLQDLMEGGIKINDGDDIGKTIIFAQNKRHAEFILTRFNKLYPQYKGKIINRVICEDSHSQAVIEDFKVADRDPYIVVSVDMMDTGIDVPECVNLVFFKKVRSKTKFWQMIGRGTRLCRDLQCTDKIDGEYTGKKRFLIFDYCGNFQFFRENPNGFDAKAVKSLTENIFTRQIELISALESRDYSDAAHKDLRDQLVKACNGRVNALNDNHTAVKLQRKHVEKFKDISSFEHISDLDKAELVDFIAPLIYLEEKDVDAKRFDNFIYGVMLAKIQGSNAFNKARNDLKATADALEKVSSIPQVAAAMEMIKAVQKETFWEEPGLLKLEEARKTLRDLIKFLDHPGPRPVIITRLTDPVIAEREGEILGQAYDFESYRQKVNRYVLEHGDTLAIYKLTHNIRLAEGDYRELERVLTKELGSSEDYRKEYGDTPFGLMVRKIAKLDHEAAMQAFSKFINDQSLNQRQIAFLNKIILYIEQNGYMENIADLTKPPFDKPVNFTKMFSQKMKAEIVAAINEIRDNAVITA